MRRSRRKRLRGRQATRTGRVPLRCPTTVAPTPARATLADVASRLTKTRFVTNSSTGITRLQLVSDWPVLAQAAFFLVTHDLYIYWMHRLQHRSRFLWRFDEAHHSVPRVDWLSGVRSHPVEILVNQTIEFAPIVLLGASPEAAVIKGAVSAIWGMYIYAAVGLATTICLSRSFEGIPVSTAYTVWMGVSILGSAVIDMAASRSLDLTRVLCILLILGAPRG